MANRMPRRIVMMAAVVLAMLAPGLAAAQEQCELPQAVPDRVGRSQTFSSRVADRSMLARRDVIWGDTGPRVPGSYALRYMPGTRDPDRPGHDVAWYQANHPDWLSYKCDRTSPAHEFSYSDGYNSPVDIANPALREDLFQRDVVPFLGTGRYQAIAVDNITSENDWGRCGSWHGSEWQQQYSGARIDAAFVHDITDWLSWLASRVHQAGMCLAVNHYYKSDDAAGFRQVAVPIDLINDENGFTRKCKPLHVGADWVEKMTVFRDLARTKALMIEDQLCDNESEVTPEVRDWSLATYLMLKGDHTYLDWEMYDKVGVLTEWPELYRVTGLPAGDFTVVGGVHARRFARALALVNPDPKVAARYDLGGESWTDISGRRVAGVIDLPPASGRTLWEPLRARASLP